MTVILHGKRDFADVIKFRILRWEFILDYPGEPHVITRVLIRGGGKSERREGNATMEAGQATWPRGKEYRQSLKGRRGKKIQLLGKKSSLAGILILKLILDVCPPELRVVNLCCFKPLGLW